MIEFIKKTLVSLLGILSLLSPIGVSAQEMQLAGLDMQAQETVSVEYPYRYQTNDDLTSDALYGETARSRCVVSTPKRADRLRFFAGEIDASISEFFSDDIRNCILLAVDIWENTIQTETPVKINFEPIDIPIGSETYGTPSNDYLLANTVVKYVFDDESRLFCPTSLYRQSHPDFKVEDGYDATIYLENGINWDYVTGGLSGYPSLIKAVLMQIGRSLGFASSVVRSDNEISVRLPRPTVYDSIIFDDKAKSFVEEAKDLEGDAYKNFAASYWEKENGICRLVGNHIYAISDGKYPNYIPATEAYPSLFSDDPMLKASGVDNYTVGMISNIGWETEAWPDQYVRFTNVSYPSGLIDIDDLLIYNYNPNEETLHRMGGVDIEVPLTDGRTGKVSLSVSIWDNYNLYGLFNNNIRSSFEKNINGDIYGTVTGTFYPVSDDGETLYDSPVYRKMRLSFVTAPEILSVSEISRKTDAGTGTLRPLLEVKYRGADQLHVEVIHGNGEAEKFTVDGPMAVWFETKFKSDENVRIRVQASNSVGIAESELYYTAGEAGVEIIDGKTVEIISTSVYDINGVFIATFDGRPDLSSLDPGMYILVENSIDGPVRRIKQLIR